MCLPSDGGGTLYTLRSPHCFPTLWQLLNCQEGHLCTISFRTGQSSRGLKLLFHWHPPPTSHAWLAESFPPPQNCHPLPIQQGGTSAPPLACPPQFCAWGAYRLGLPWLRWAPAPGLSSGPEGAQSRCLHWRHILPPSHQSLQPWRRDDGRRFPGWGWQDDLAQVAEQRWFSRGTLLSLCPSCPAGSRDSRKPAKGSSPEAPSLQPIFLPGLGCELA